MHSIEELPVVVVGGGPVGLAAAAHLLSRSIETVVLEAGPDIASNMRSWRHVRLFSTWRYNVDLASAALLEGHGWAPPPPDDLPTGDDIVEGYLRPLARVPAMSRAIHLDSRVVAITRLGTDKIKTAGRDEAPFVVRTRSIDRTEREILARAVIDASGTWATPNPLGASGVPALGEVALAHLIHFGIPDVLGSDRARYEGRTTLVVGAGHSAANSILALVELAEASSTTRVVWATRGSNLTRVFGGGDADGLKERGRLGARLRALVESGGLRLVTDFRVGEVRREGDAIVVRGTRAGESFELSGIDRIVAATGQRPDLGMTRELRLELDPALESVLALGPLIDPNEHSCGSVRPHGEAELRQPEPNFYVVGGKSYGRAPTFLLATGYEQVRSIVAYLARDYDAAKRVELNLPETGVCSTSSSPASGGCCEPTPQRAPDAGCCPTPQSAVASAGRCGTTTSQATKTSCC